MSFFQKLSSFVVGDDLINNNCLLAFDIGTNFVKAAIFNIESTKEVGERRVVLGVGRAEIKKGGDADEAEEVVKSCKEAKLEAENMAGCSARQALVGMAARPIRCSTSVISCQRKNFHKPIDLSEIKSMIQKAQWKSFDEIRRKEATECGLSEIEIKLIDGRIINIKIDGYNVVDPVGFEGKEVLLTILNIHATSSCLNLLNRIKKLLEIEIVSFIPSSYAVVTSVSSSIFKTNNLSDVSCTVVDCGGGATDVFLACGGILGGPKTFSLGGEVFTRRLETELKLQKKEAEELKVKYSAGQVSPQIKRKITNIFGADLKFWHEGIKAALNNFYAAGGYPGLILLIGGGSLLPGIKKILEEKEWQQDCKFLEQVRVKAVEKKEFERIDDRTGLLSDADSIGLVAVINFAFNLTKSMSHIDSILHRIIRLMQT